MGWSDEEWSAHADHLEGLLVKAEARAKRLAEALRVCAGALKEAEDATRGEDVSLTIQQAQRQAREALQEGNAHE